mgnify:CR=1 FL=1
MALFFGLMAMLNIRGKLRMGIAINYVHGLKTAVPAEDARMSIIVILAKPVRGSGERVHR